MSHTSFQQLAQVGLGGDLGKAVVQAVAIQALFILLLILSVGLLIWGLVTIRRARGKIMAVVGAVLFGSLAWTAYVVMFPPPPPVQSIAFDFTKSREPPPGRYPGAGGLGWLSYHGRIDLTLRLPRNLTFIDRATRVTLQRRDARIAAITVERSGLTRDEARLLQRKYASWNGKSSASTDGDSTEKADEMSTSVDMSHRGDEWTIRITTLWQRSRSR